MVVKMVKWRPWPPQISSKRSETRIVVGGLKGSSKGLGELGKLCVEISWKGSKGNYYALSSLRNRSVKRNFTREENLGDDGVVMWNEEFQNICSFSPYKDGLFHSWEVVFTVFNGLEQGNKLSVVATGSLNLAEFASMTVAKEHEISIPLTVPGGNVECSPSLCISLSFLELRIDQESSTMAPSPLPEEAIPIAKEEVSAIKAGLRKVKILTRYVSAAQRAMKECRELEGGLDGRSEYTEYNYSFDTDSVDEVESEEGKNEDASLPTPIISYGTLADANNVGSFYSNATNSDDEDWIYYNNNNNNIKSKVDLIGQHLDQSLPKQSSKPSILPWKKRKVRFNPPKVKGEPLLKKDCGEEGGDDIDFDRRQLNSADEAIYAQRNVDEDSNGQQSSVSEFGDDNFAVGSWEKIAVTSRDGHLKLQTQVFFASIDQRNEKAAGESACTALVAVIADWFHQSNIDEIKMQMPIKSQLDSLIREGSLEWRNLCENEVYKERFPDRHFDLETVLQAKIRPLSVVPEKSFVGFFHPEGLEGEEGLDFLHSAMSFDSIWDEISAIGSNKQVDGDDPLIYIVSWNDHFFVLKVEQDAYYIIDTLGERLFEGCNQSYILKFDKDTIMGRISVDEEESVVCRGKDSCREYIKSFLAAIPVRELQVDLKKGLMTATPLHHRLQIEFHYTQFSSEESTA